MRLQSENYSISGIIFSAIERMPKEQASALALFFDWYGQTECIKVCNSEVNNQWLNFGNDGRRRGDSYILKG